MPSLLYLSAIFILGCLGTEIIGYFWHRWVAHLGVLKRITPYDFLRKRHVQHHEIDYNPNISARLIADSYVEACEVAFNVLGMLAIVTLLTLTFVDVISWWVFSAFLAGMFFYTFVFLGPFHAYFHLTDQALKRIFWFKPNFTWQPFKWLQEYHEAHHYYNCNYSIVLPVDIIFGSYVSPARLRELKLSGQLKKENIFPGFTNSPSKCKEPIFVK